MSTSNMYASDRYLEFNTHKHCYIDLDLPIPPPPPEVVNAVCFDISSDNEVSLLKDCSESFHVPDYVADVCERAAVIADARQERIVGWLTKILDSMKEDREWLKMIHEDFASERLRRAPMLCFPD